MMLKTKSVSSPIEPKSDGLRILIARFRGRGMPKTRYDVWMPNLAPSEDLVKAFLAEEITWTEFSRRYKAEMHEDAALDERNALIKNHGQKFTLRLLKTLSENGNVTLMCHCAEDDKECHRHLLKKLIEKA